MAMDDFALLYGKLRAAILSRHFAINERFRTNFFFSDNRLETKLPINDFYNLTPDEQEKERWRWINHGGDNPLMFSGKLMTCLAVEFYLGRQDGLPVIHALLDSIDVLYKFQGRGDHFDGYIIRADPVVDSGDSWDIDAYTGRSYHKNFFMNQDLTYNYCTPLHDPRSRRKWSEAEWNAASTQKRERYWDEYSDFMHARHWEPSMDELMGLVMGYDMVYRLVNVPAVRTKVSNQVNRLGDYLAEYGYYLVRPDGGFSARGASGVLPALEYPFSQVFQRITGNPYYIRNGFQAVMQKADVWGALEERFNLWSAVLTIAELGGFGMFRFIGSIVDETGLGFLFGTTGPFTLAQLGQIAAIYTLSDVFDVALKLDEGKYDQSAAQEFAMAYALSLLSLRRRFDDYMTGSEIASITSNAAGFPPFLGLTGLVLGQPGLLDPEPNVRNAYLNWLPGRRNKPDLPADNIAFSSFASGVAVMLDAGWAEETHLKDLLQAQLDDFYGRPGHPNQYRYDLPLTTDAHKVNYEESPMALDYMVGLSLAWLHRKLRQDARQPIATAGFPDLPDSSAWYRAEVPANVLVQAQSGTIPLPLDAIQRTQPLHLTSYGSAELFYDNPVVPRSPVPNAVLPSGVQGLVWDQTVTVPESASDVPTGIRLHLGDEFEIEYTGGLIKPGVFDPLGRGNGPNGWNRIEYDRKFLLTGRPNGHPYCLLGKLGENGAYFFVGERWQRQRYLGYDTNELFLRINDDTPGNGRGAFTCQVRVWGASLAIPDFQAFNFILAGWLPLPPSVWFRVHSSTHPRALVTLTVSRDGGPFYVVRSENPYSSPPSQEDWENREVHTNTPDQLYLFWLGGTMGGPNYRNRNGTYEFRIRATDIGGGVSDELSTKVFIEWHGSRITCINKKPRRDTTRAIQSFGGLTSDRRNWRLTLAEAIAEVESGHRFYVEQPQGDRVEVVVAVSTRGHKYLKTVADGDEPNNLLSLTECS